MWATYIKLLFIIKNDTELYKDVIDIFLQTKAMQFYDVVTKIFSIYLFYILKNYFFLSNLLEIF